MGRRSVLVWVAAVAVIACADPSTVVCDDGTLCPEGSVCVDTSFDRCAFQDQLDACRDNSDGDSCSSASVPSGICREGLCHQPACGDGYVDPGERCDPVATPPVPEAEDDCTDHGWYFEGAVSCRDDCTLDQSACRGRCGDDATNGTEFCDGESIPAGPHCLNRGFDRGIIGCTNECTADESSCAYLGWHVSGQFVETALSSIWSVRSNLVIAVGGGGNAYVFDGSEWLESATPTTNRLEAVGASADASLILAVGDRTILRYDTTSSTWTAMTVPVQVKLMALRVVNASTAYAVGSAGTLLRYDGTGWTQEATGTAADLRAVWVAPTGEVWVGGNFTVGYRSGADWTWLTPTSAGNIRALWGRHHGDVFFGNANGVNWRWNGQRVTPMNTLVGLSQLWGIGPHLMAVGEKGSMNFFAGRRSWVRTDISASEDTVAIHGSTPDDLWLVTDQGTILRSDGRGYWSDLGRFMQRAYRDVHAPDPEHVRLVGGVEQSAGAGWFDTYLGNAEIMGNVKPSVLYAVATTEETAFAVGTAGAVATWDGGSAFVVEHTPVSTDLHGVWASASGRIYAVGDAGTIIRRDAGGWSAMQSGTTADLRGIWGASDTDIYAVGRSGTVVRYDGSSWTAETSGTTARLERVSGADGLVVAVGTDGTILHRDAGTWSVIPSPTIMHLRDVEVFSNKDALAVGHSGTTLLWEDGRWQLLRGPNTSLDFTGISGTPGDVFIATSDDITYRFVRTSFASCAVSETTCDNRWDDDCDGLLDCADSDCASSPACEATETACGDGHDNDGDGLIDCHDSDCDGVAVERCNDWIDQDCDGDVGCADSDCFADPYCSGTCWFAAELTCDSEVTVMNAGLPSKINSYSCGGAGGNGEFSYRYEAGTSGPVTVELVDLTQNYDLYVLPSAGGDCLPNSCIGYSAELGNESVTFTATAGETYFFVVEEPPTANSEYTIVLTCP